MLLNYKAAIINSHHYQMYMFLNASLNLLQNIFKCREIRHIVNLANH